MNRESGDPVTGRKRVIRERVQEHETEPDSVDMSDIDALLAAAADVGEGQKSHSQSRFESDFDLDALLREGESSELREIGSLLRKDENHELIEPASEIRSAEEAARDHKKPHADNIEPQTDNKAPQTDKELKRAEREAARAAKKAEKRAAKEAKKAEREAARAAKRAENLDSIVDRVARTSDGGFWGRIMTFLLQEDEEEELPAEEESLNLSDENLLILEALKKESREDQGGAGRSGAETDGNSSSKEKKKKKEKKPPKASKAAMGKKRGEADDEPAVKLSPKKVRLIALLGFSLTVFLIFFTLLGADMVERSRAKREFYKGNYQESYQGFFGKSLNNSEQVIFYKSEVILRMRLRLKRYEWMAEKGQRAEALDSLIQSVALHPPLREMAQRWNAEEEMDELYERLLSYLQDYGLTEADALEIAGLADDVSYSKAVYEIAGGMGVRTDVEPIEDGGPIQEAADRLPEEELLPETFFIEE